MTDDSMDKDQDRDQTLVTIGDGQQVSMQVVQDIYSEITGKKETLTKPITSNHHISFDDISQLNIKICQLYEQYNVVSSQCSVTIYRLDDKKEQFSSFERFKLYDGSSSSPVENINITYHLLILLPQIRTPQSYKISINLHSRAALRKRARSESGLPRKFFHLLGGPTGMIDIEYVDYTVARTFYTAISEWADSLQVENGSRAMALLQRYSEHFPFLSRAITTLAMVLVVVVGFERMRGDQWPLGDIFVLGVIVFGGVYLMAQIAFKVGQMAERYIDEYQPNSALRLTKGDERVAEELDRGNRSSVLKGAGSFVFLVFLNIVATWLAHAIGVVG